MTDIDEKLPDEAIDAVLATMDDDASGSSSPPAIIVASYTGPEPQDTKPNIDDRVGEALAAFARMAAEVRAQTTRHATGRAA